MTVPQNLKKAAMHTYTPNLETDVLVKFQKCARERVRLPRRQRGVETDTEYMCESDREIEGEFVCDIQKEKVTSKNINIIIITHRISPVRWQIAASH